MAGYFPEKTLGQKEKAAEANGLPAAATGTKTMKRKVQSKKDRRDQAADRQAVQRRPPLRAALMTFFFGFAVRQGVCLSAAASAAALVSKTSTRPAITTPTFSGKNQKIILATLHDCCYECMLYA